MKNYSMIKVITNSMYPVIKPYQNIIIKEEADYKVGDVIAYKTDDIIIVHRIISVNENLIVTKGDNNKISDKQFERRYVLGKVINLNYKTNKLYTLEMFNFQKNPFYLILFSLFYVGFYLTKEMTKMATKEIISETNNNT